MPVWTAEKHAEVETARYGLVWMDYDGERHYHICGFCAYPSGGSEHRFSTPIQAIWDTGEVDNSAEPPEPILGAVTRSGTRYRLYGYPQGTSLDGMYLIQSVATARGLVQGETFDYIRDAEITNLPIYGKEPE